MKIIIDAEPKEIAALVVAVQEQRNESYVLVREPYQRHYSLVKVGAGRDVSLGGKIK